MVRKNNEKLKSEIISDFLNLMTNAKQDYSIADDKIGEAGKATQDLLHEIEFSSRAEVRSKSATKLHLVRNDRRYYKDKFEEAEILVEYLKDHEKAVNKLRETLGKMRNVEYYHENRNYYPRVIKE